MDMAYGFRISALVYLVGKNVQLSKYTRQFLHVFLHTFVQILKLTTAS